MADVRHCDLCGFQLDPLYVHLLVEIHGDGTATSHCACALCDAMVRAADTPYFDRCEREHMAHIERVKRLKPGADYIG